MDALTKVNEKLPSKMKIYIYIYILLLLSIMQRTAMNMIDVAS